MPTPIYVIAGYLGSGKTTLINHVLATAPSDLKIMVLVNDLGKISVDAKLIKGDPLNVVDLSGGCICCGMFTELMASIRFALDILKADIILIEGSGLSVPRQIAGQALTPVFEGRVEFGGIVAVVDVRNLLAEQPPIVGQQLEGANVIVLNKTDLVDSESLMKARSRLRLIAPAASLVLETTFGRVDYREIFSRRYDSSLINSKSGKRSSGISTAGFGAICFVSNSPISEPALLQLYRKHRDKIVRSKGFIVTEKGTAELQLSGSVIEIKPAQNAIQRTELVLIVREQDKELLEDEFKKVFAGKGE